MTLSRCVSITQHHLNQGRKYLKVERWISTTLLTLTEHCGSFFFVEIVNIGGGISVPIDYYNHGGAE